MAQFLYTAIDATGKTIKGSLDAASKREAYQQLEGDALTPVEVEIPKHRQEVEAERAALEESGKPPKLKRGQLIHFTEELADLLDAGLQLQQALGIMEERQEDKDVRRMSAALREEIKEGASVSAALKNTSPTFDDLYCNLVAAGEASGSLPEILRRLAGNLTILNELRARVIQAMIYPAFMIGACILLMVVFTTVLIPQLTGLLTKTGQELPLVTRGLLKFTDFVTSYWWCFLVAIAVFIFLFRAIVARPSGRLWWDEIKLKLPLVGPVIATRFYASFCHALGNLIQNGVPLLNSLKLMTRATSNMFQKGELEQVVADVSGGDALSNSMKRRRGFPILMVDMVAVGEQTGNISKSLTKAAGRYDKELDKRITRMTSLITPIIIIFMAFIVTVVAYSIVSAIFTSVSGIRGS